MIRRGVNVPDFYDEFLVISHDKSWKEICVDTIIAMNNTSYSLTFAERMMIVSIVSVDVVINNEGYLVRK